MSEREELQARVNSLQKAVEEKSKKIENFEQKNIQLEKSLHEEVEKGSNLITDHNAALEKSGRQIEEIQFELNKKVNLLWNNFSLLLSLEKWTLHF